MNEVGIGFVCYLRLCCERAFRRTILPVYAREDGDENRHSNTRTTMPRYLEVPSARAHSLGKVLKKCLQPLGRYKAENLLGWILLPVINANKLSSTTQLFKSIMRGSIVQKYHTCDSRRQIRYYRLDTRSNFVISARMIEA